MPNLEKAKNNMPTATPPAPAGPASPVLPEHSTGGADASTLTVSRGEWHRLLDMVAKLTASQAELSNGQAKLLAQLAHANARIQELEHEKAALATPQANCQPTSPPTPLAAPAPTADTLARPEMATVAAPCGPSQTFRYTVKRPPQAGIPPTRPARAPKQKSWAEIAAAPRPQLADLSAPTQERLRKGLALLTISGPEPRPTALYFRNIRRARLGQVRSALRCMFPHPWAVLGLSFIGQSILEIVCHTGLADQIVAKLRVIGALHLKNFDIFGDNLKKQRPDTNKDRIVCNLEKAQSRLQRLSDTCTSPAAKTWYSRQAAVAEQRIASVYRLAHDVETSVSDASSDSSDPEYSPDTASHTSDDMSDQPAMSAVEINAPPVLSPPVSGTPSDGALDPPLTPSSDIEMAPAAPESH